MSPDLARVPSHAYLDFEGWISRCCCGVDSAPLSNEPLRALLSPSMPPLRISIGSRFYTVIYTLQRRMHCNSLINKT